MAAEGGGGKEMNEIKTQFTTREGAYKLLTHSEYSRPNRVPFNSQGSNPVKVSFVNVNDQSGNGERICFNRNLFSSFPSSTFTIGLLLDPGNQTSSQIPASDL
ncbi:WD repeat-containing protein 20 [Silurus asotus]|uniref:WD repeat-containing protein 20 n=1 Tax=Silurus asotus TaxID=30991 RepID=A0AAD5FV05_SILAS|nr:WD repeat-containing protein 20 [Silurus asotus]